MHEDTNTIALLDRVTSGLVTDVDRLVEGGVRRGRIRRRRRRIGTTLAAAAVVGIIGVAASLAPGLQGESSTGTDAGQVADPGKPEPSAKEQKAPASARDLNVRADQIPELVTDLFPGAISLASERTGRFIDDGPETQVAHFLWNGFLTTVGAWRASAGDVCGKGKVECRMLPDGSTLVRWPDVTGPEVDGAVTGRGISLFTTDGWEIFTVSYNAADGKDVPTLAEEPPFAVAQLEQIVTRDVWFR